MFLFFFFCTLASLMFLKCNAFLAHFMTRFRRKHISKSLSFSSKKKKVSRVKILPYTQSNGACHRSVRQSLYASTWNWRHTEVEYRPHGTLWQPHYGFIPNDAICGCALSANIVLKNSTGQTAPSKASNHSAHLWIKSWSYIFYSGHWSKVHYFYRLFMDYCRVWTWQ